MSRRGAGTGRWTRAGIALQVTAAAVLAAVAAALVPWLAERPGLHRRADLSAARHGSLDPATVELLDVFDEPVAVEVFFRLPDPPWREVGAEVQARTREFLLRARAAAPTRLRVVDHDLGDVATVKERMRDLRIAEHNLVNVLVVHSGDRRAVLELFKDVSEVDMGNPVPGAGYAPASVRVFRAEEAFAGALKKISAGEPPRVLFSSGHGERDLYGTESRQLGRLHTALVRDGFVAEPWDATAEPRIPDDVVVLALVDPRQPFTPEELDAIRTFVDRGGRVLAAPGPDAPTGPRTLHDLVREWGALVPPGLVCRPQVDPYTKQKHEGIQRCADLLIASDGMAPGHPVTRPLYRGQRHVRLPIAGAVERGSVPPGGVLIDVLSSTTDSWRDLPDARGYYDYSFRDGEEPGPFSLAAAITFPPRVDPEGPPAPGVEPDSAEERESRVLVLPCPDALGQELFDANRDLLLNAFNWLASRDFRVSVTPRDPSRAVLDLSDGGDMATMVRVASYGLPGACLLVGILFGLWRRRS